jgi:uncharacterized protein (DUF58 family)
VSESLFDHDLLARLGAIPLEARMPMLGNVAGRHRSPHRGSSVEFAEYRKYVPGDDTRRLDWKAFARSDRYYIKEFEADTNLRAYFVIDHSASMAFSDRGMPKYEYASRVVANLSYLFVNQGDAVGLSLCREALHREIPPRRNPAHLSLIQQTLQELKPMGQTGLVDALHQVAEKIAQRAVVVILSDLFCETSEFEKALQHLRYRKHDVCVFHLMDPQEIAFQFDRPHRFVDLEDQTSLVVEPQLIAEEYQHALRDFLLRVKQACHKVHADYQLVTTDSPLEPLLRDFLLHRLPKKGKG